MLVGDLTKSAIAATAIVAVLHLLIRLGSQGIWNLASMGFMPGSYAELALSGSPAGFGDWRTLVVVNLASWICYLVLFFLLIRLWRH